MKSCPAKKAPLEAAALRAKLAGCSLAREIVVLDETTSTNDIAANFAREGAAAGLIVFAETQTAGRGRLGRKWECAPGEGLSFSILLRPQIPSCAWTRLALFAAVAVAEGIEEAAAIRAEIKWPNDIYLGGKKAAGILIESRANEFAVLGIGVNVNQTHFPQPLENRATSLRLMTGHEFDRDTVAVSLLRKLDAYLPKLHDDFSAIIAAAENRNFLRGRWIEADDGGAPMRGRAEKFDENGALILRKENGETLALSSGEVTLAGM